MHEVAVGELLKARKVGKKLGLIYQGEAPSSSLVLRLLLLFLLSLFCWPSRPAFVMTWHLPGLTKPEETSQPGIQKRKPTFSKILIQRNLCLQVHPVLRV